MNFISDLHEQVHNDKLFSIDKHNGYAFGLFFSAYQAKSLGHRSITCVEIGVAGGNGLLALEEIAFKVSEDLDIKVQLLGLDTGEGMPAPLDYRDLPYTWRQGQYKIDLNVLQSKLSLSKLVIGNVSDTIPDLLKSYDFQNSPLAFVSFDVDYYSSTRDALLILQAPSIPRTILFFDDLVSTDLRYISEDVGQLAAINDFNALSKESKIRFIEHLGFNRPNNALWTRKIYCHHNYTHPLYNSYIDWNTDKQLRLI